MASVDDVDGGETFDEEAEERDEGEIEQLLNELSTSLPFAMIRFLRVMTRKRKAARRNHQR